MVCLLPVMSNYRHVCCINTYLYSKVTKTVTDYNDDDDDDDDDDDYGDSGDDHGERKLNANIRVIVVVLGMQYPSTHVWKVKYLFIR